MAACEKAADGTTDGGRLVQAKLTVFQTRHLPCKPEVIQNDIILTHSRTEQPLNFYLEACNQSFEPSQLYSAGENRKFIDQSRRLSGTERGVNAFSNNELTVFTT